MRFLLLLLFVVLSAGCGHGPASTPAAQPRTEAPNTRITAEAAASPPAADSSPNVKIAEPLSEEPQPVQPVYRPDDDRPHHDDDELRRFGIQKFASKRLVLYSDVDEATVGPLPALVDALYDDWVAYFGELPPARDGSDFQVTGYLMSDADRFAAAGLIPPDLPTFPHGIHRGRQFWLLDQTYDYYRAHLLLHEATHCFMMCLPGSLGPTWYMEGMAEHFAAHRRTKERPLFRVLPSSRSEMLGFDRIDLVRREIRDGRFKTLDELFALPPREFVNSKHYEWAWAACCFLDLHPHYRDRFRALGEPSLRSRFAEEFGERFQADSHRLATEWALFTHSLCYGFDVERAMLEIVPGTPLSSGNSIQIEVSPDRGWQSSGVRVEAGTRYRLTADGMITLAEEPKPWLSDARGITLDYAEGRPVGMLLAAVLAESNEAAPDPAGGLLSPLEVGQEAIITAPATGTLYLRVNDHWDRLADNKGQLELTISAAAD